MAVHLPRILAAFGHVSVQQEVDLLVRESVAACVRDLMLKHPGQIQPLLAGLPLHQQASLAGLPLEQQASLAGLSA